jgi:hypothetical protein
MANRASQFLVGSLLGLLLLILLLVSDLPRRLTARVLDEDTFLYLQILSDFDRDGDVDFLDFTVFSAFYEEEVS